MADDGAPAVRPRGVQHKASSSKAEAPVLRLLALHGFVQNSAVFRERTGSLRKAVKGVAELFFVDAPHSAAGAFPDSDKTALGGGDDGDVRGWWLAGENQSDNSAGWVRPSLSVRARGFDESLACLRAAIRDQGPFDGVLGFSQGAAMAGLLLASDPSSFRFGILVAGFVPHDPALGDAMQNAAPLPHALLSVSGTGDALVPAERVAKLASCFESRTVEAFSHDGGHFVPSSKAFRDALKAFLAAQLAAKQAGGVAEEATQTA